MTRTKARVGKRLWQDGPSKRRDKVLSNHEVDSTPHQSQTPRSDGSTTAAIVTKDKLPIPPPVATNTQPTTPPVAPNTQLTTPPVAPNTQPIDEQANIESTAASVQGISASRGANLSKDAPENPEDREVIHIVGTRFQPNSVVRQIVSSIKNQMGPYPTWLSVAKDLKNELWAEFEEMYQFSNEVEHKKARKVWEQVCAIRYKDLMKKARDEAKKKTGLTTYNFEKMAEYPPSFMKKEYWVSFCEGWNKESWQKISNSGSTNRKKGGKLNHVGGSIPFISHARKLENEKKTKPTHIEVFDLTHTKDGVYCNDKARKVGEKYKSDIGQKYGSNEPIFDADLWTEASGGIKKGRVFGLGSSEDLKASGFSESISTNASTSRFTPSPTSPDMQSLILAAMETPQFQAMMDARQKQFEEAMQKQFQEGMRKLREKSLNLPNNDDVDVEDEHDEDSGDSNEDGCS